MPADLGSVGIVLLSWTATYLLHSTVLLGGVWLLFRAHRAANDVLREVLWKTALVGGVLTATIQVLTLPESRFADLTFTLGSVCHSGEPITVPSDRLASASDAAAAEFAVSDVALEPSKTLEIWVGEDVSSDRDKARPTTSMDVLDGNESSWVAGAKARPWLERSRVLAIALVAIGLPMLFGIASCLHQTIALQRKLAHCTPIENGLPGQILDDLRQSVPRAPVVLLLLAPGDSEPAAFGARRWTIVLPERALAELSEDELRALLAHELAHLVRGDAIWLAISRLACSLLAFQPLNHLARREWQRAAEILCDNWAVSRTAAPLALARCLAAVAGWRLSRSAPGASLAATGRSAGLVNRIERLLDARPQLDVWSDVRAARRSALLTATALLAGSMGLAPRVQLAWAVQPEPPGIEAPRSATSAPLLAHLEEGESAAAETDLETTREEQNAGISRARSWSASVKSASVNRPSVSRGAIPKRFESIDQDLRDLEHELRELEPLMRARAEPGSTRLVDRLQGEIGRLRERREALLRAAETVLK